MNQEEDTEAPKVSHRAANANLTKQVSLDISEGQSEYPSASTHQKQVNKVVKFIDTIKQ